MDSGCSVRQRDGGDIAATAFCARNIGRIVAGPCEGHRAIRPADGAVKFSSYRGTGADGGGRRSGNHHYRINRQCAEVFNQRVVSFHSRAVPCKSVGIRAAAHLRLATRERERGSFRRATRCSETAETAARCQWRAVIVAACAFCLHRQGSGLDFQLSVLHNENHAREILIGILEVSFQNTHFVCADILLSHCPRRCRGRSDRCFHIVQGGTGCHTGISIYGMCFTVIRDLVALFRHCHRHSNRVDFLPARCHIEGYRGEVGVGIDKIRRGESHIGRTGNGSLSCSHGGVLSGLCEVGFCVQTIANGYVIAVHAMFRTIVVVRRCVAFDGHRYVNRINFLMSIRHIKCYRSKVRVGVREMI